MSTSAEFRPKGGDLAVRVAESRSVEILPDVSNDGKVAVRSAAPTPLALKLRGIRLRNRHKPGVPPYWLLIVLAVPTALMALIGLVLWRVWPQVHQALNVRVDLLVEGVWQIGQEIVAKK